MAKTKRNRKVKHKKKGGALIGKGSYGCVYRPALRCSGASTRSPQRISKLTDANTAFKEQTRHYILHMIDPQQQYFIYTSRICLPAAFDPQINGYLSDCQLMQPDPINPNKVSIGPIANPQSLELPDGGTELSFLTINTADYPAFFSSFTNAMIAVKVLQGVQEIIPPTSQTTTTLSTQNVSYMPHPYFHLDIKRENIVSLKQSDGSFFTRLIDFDLLTDFYNFYNIISDKMLRDAYAIWPAETICLSNIVENEFFQDYINDDNGITTPQGVEQQMQANFDKYFDKWKKGAIIFSGKYVPHNLYLHWINRTRKDFYNIRKELRVVENRLRFVKSMDVYMLGVALGFIYITFTGHIYTIDKSTGKSYFHFSTLPNAVLPPDFQTYHNEVASNLSIKIEKLIYDMSHYDYNKRISIEQAISRYEALLPLFSTYFTEANVRNYMYSIVGTKITLAQQSIPSTLTSSTTLLPAISPINLTRKRGRTPPSQAATTTTVSSSTQQTNTVKKTKKGKNNKKENNNNENNNNENNI